MVEADSISICDIDEVAELRQVEELQMDVWGRTPLDVVPMTQLVAARNVGGMILGAFDGKRLVGFAYGFLGALNTRIVFHSHMLAVLPGYRNLRLGFRLKLAQRERVLARQLTDRITWTFDPLQSLNAHFNFVKLGVLSDTYKIDVYGAQTSSILHRNGTDRLFVTWLLGSPRVISRAAVHNDSLHNDSLHGGSRHDAPHSSTTGHATQTDFALADFALAAIPLLRVGDDLAPQLCDTQMRDALGASEHVFIEIPPDINLLQRHSPDLARLWRERTRFAFTHALDANFVVRDFRRITHEDQARGVYLLSRGRLDDFAV